VKANQYRKQVQKAELTGNITLPSGAIFKMRRPPLDVWMASGRIPQSFLRAMLEAQQGGAQAATQFSTEETLEGLTFLTEAVIYAAVEPRLAMQSDDEEVLALSDLDPEDFRFLTSWIQAGSPGVPVKTSTGEVQPEKLARFRQKRAGGGFVGDSTDSGEIRDTSERAAGAGG
jgi:hypothetical protein